MRLHHLAIGTVAATIGLMILGSLVHGTGSSLACPDWPLCHGTAFPEMTGGVQFEHTHRLVAAAVVVLAIALLVGSWRTQDRIARRLAGAACGLVALQATLGGLTVLLRLPPAVSIAHLATSMTFLSVVVLLAVRLTPINAKEEDSRSRALSNAVGAASLLAFLQIVLGGVVRHTGAALACPDMPLCSGAVWPSGALQRVQMAHRALGVIAAVATLVATGTAVRHARRWGSRLVIGLPAMLVVVQVTLGVALVVAGSPLWLATMHHATGAMTLASLVLAWATTDGRLASSARPAPSQDTRLISIMPARDP